MTHVRQLIAEPWEDKTKSRPPESRGNSRATTLQRAGRLLEGGRHDLRRQVQVLAQVLDALV